MLVVVTVNTEVFPVGAVRGIVGGVAVLVVDREKAAVLDSNSRPHLAQISP